MQLFVSLMQLLILFNHVIRLYKFYLVKYHFLLFALTKLSNALHCFISFPLKCLVHVSDSSACIFHINVLIAGSLILFVLHLSLQVRASCLGH